MTRTFALPILAAVLLTTSALAGGTVAVSQRGRAFAQSALQIARGDTVRFLNEDQFVHQVYASAPSFSFDTVEKGPGEGVEVPFPVAGTFQVRCHIHPKMILTVDVR